MTSLKKHVQPITASLVCPYKLFTDFWGGGFDHPPNFRIDQSQRSISQSEPRSKSVLKLRIPLLAATGETQKEKVLFFKVTGEATKV